MLRTRKTPLVTVFVLLVIATLFGCSLLLRDGAEQSGWYIKLNINHPAVAKALTVTEYDVTGLAIEVYDPDGELIEEISWQVAEGQQSYLIPVSEQGQHKIVVTHISEENGETVEAEESATFNIQAMVITVIDIIPGCIGMIEVEPGIQDGPPAEDVNECALAVMTALWEAMAPLYQGSDEFPPGVTVDESNFIPPGDDPPFGGIVIVAFTDYTPSGSDVTVNGDITIEITFPPDLLGTFEEAISASLSVSCLPGETVDIDLTLSMFMEDAPYWQTLQWAGAITVDGQEADLDQVMSDWLEMVLGPATPTDGTLTVRVTGADAYNGALFHYAVGAIGTDLYDQANWLGVAPSNLTISGGMVEFITIVNGTNTPAYFTSGVSYDVAALIDVDGDNWPTSNVDYIYGPEPVVVNGDTILELDFAADFHLVPLSDSFGIVIGDYSEYRLTNHMTLEAWVFPRASASTNGRRNVIISKSPWVSNAGYSMYIEGSSLIVDNHNKGLHTAVVDESFFDSWHHVAWSFDAPVSSIYIDGVLRSSRSYWSAMGVSDKPLTIGSYPTVPNGQFAGCICDVSIWSVARAGDDID